jgi:type VI protein secretion system component VasK
VAGSSNRYEKHPRQQYHYYDDARGPDGGMDDGSEPTSSPPFSPRKPDAKAERAAANGHNYYSSSRLKSCLLAPSAALAPALARLHPRLRPWHVFSAAGTIVVVLVVVLTATLMHARNMRLQAVQTQIHVRAHPKRKKKRKKAPSAFCFCFPSNPDQTAVSRPRENY